MSTNPTSLDPRKGRLLYDLNIPRMLFEGLTRINQEGEAQLAGAEAVSISDDGKTYTFSLRSNRWSNGQAVTSQDYLYAWQSALAPSFPSPMASQLFVIKNAKQIKNGELPPEHLGVSTPSSHELVVELEEPTPYFLELAASATCLPLPLNIDEDNPNWAQQTGPGFPCNGPFTLASWDQGNEMRLKKNPYYWNSQEVHLNQVTLLIGGDLQTSLNLFERNELDWVGSPLSGLPPDSLQHLKKQHLAHFKPIAGTHWYFFNVDRFPFQNKKIRKAFSLAVNRHSLIHHLLQGEQPPACGILPPTMRSNPLPSLDGKAEDAKQMLMKGLKEMDLQTPKDLGKITLTYSRGEIGQKVAEAIQQQWKQVLGVEVELLGLEGKTFFQTRSSRDFQICSGNWLGDYNDPSNFLDLFESKDLSTNHTNWESAHYQTLLTQARSAKTPAERKLALEQAEQFFLSEMPLIPLYHISLSYVKRGYVKDVTLTPTGFIDLSTANIER